jgi:hypothetical protein
VCVGGGGGVVGPLTLENVGFPSLTFGKRARERDGFCKDCTQQIRLEQFAAATQRTALPLELNYSRAS